tara:strand:- start:15973 stop:16185 length:213 start_codon:yes stop_codon:yes gene_type:complete
MDFETIKKITTFLSTEVDHGGITIEVPLLSGEYKQIQSELSQVIPGVSAGESKKFEINIGDVRFRLIQID